MQQLLIQLPSPANVYILGGYIGTKNN